MACGAAQKDSRHCTECCHELLLRCVNKRQQQKKQKHGCGERDVETTPRRIVKCVSFRCIPSVHCVVAYCTIFFSSTRTICCISDTVLCGFFSFSIVGHLRLLRLCTAVRFFSHFSFSFIVFSCTEEKKIVPGIVFNFFSLLVIVKKRTFVHFIHTLQRVLIFFSRSRRQNAFFFFYPTPSLLSGRKGWGVMSRWSSLA